ncbi:hypothetical protein BS47DRAFT_262838 [Hydnum rufescens UP504]|uniref:MYND-type domain-containing protein n=1 Tax=Hydnum rufescens UP504 TaxID=1448309 RepID=A0A9P6B6B7_9AGAM|nr:hypothetical protein BS47DRAFT_262838 [Hydnum rufescens UP504]
MEWAGHFVKENGFLSSSPVVSDGRLTKDTTQQSVAIFDFVANNFCVFLKNMMAAESDPCLVGFTGAPNRSLQLLRICQDLARLWLSPHLHDVWVSQFPNDVSVEHQDICLALILYLSPTPFIFPRDPTIGTESYRSLALRARKCLARSVHPDDLWAFALATVLDYLSDTNCRAISCPHAMTSNKVFRCAACKTIPYCSRECQRASWKAHKPECNTLQLFGDRLLDGLLSIYMSGRGAAVERFKERCADACIGEVVVRVFLMVEAA